jgi:hypothetical protein
MLMVSEIDTNYAVNLAMVFVYLIDNTIMNLTVRHCTQRQYLRISNTI